ncbi:rod-binding protein [Allosphingosinicella indica]|uniref:Flagellar protein FlgJ n=1 Tax=Allosphingosinicella indica TaxID=941907 RepID=A0A1X7GNT9_9SPHN|nr:rod-binding protein [Allosphingosinicella indica]SMF72463.1 flagellar protein FlgJ [Allosphingosinicella indica]
MIERAASPANKPAAGPDIGAGDAARVASLKQAAQAFEAVFLRQMIGSMRQAKLTEDELFGSSSTEQFQSMADAKLADNMAEKSNFGIADLLLRQFGAKLGTPQTADGGKAE